MPISELSRSLMGKHSLKHGYTRSPTYVSWQAMKQRCLNPNSANYKYYGGRGITFDPDWCEFETFLADMGERPRNTSLDRIDNDRNYELTNCRWADAKTQANNRRKRNGHL